MCVRASYLRAMASLMRSCLKGCACDAAPLTYRKYALSSLVRYQSRPTRRGGQGPQGHPRTLSRSVGPFERSVRCAPERKSTPAQVWIRVHNPLIALLAHGATHGAHPEVSAPVTSRRDRWELQVPPGIRERAVLAAQEAHKSAHALRDAEVRVHAVAREAAEAEAERLNRDLPPDEPVEFKTQMPEYRTRLGDLRGGHSFRVAAQSVSFVKVGGAEVVTAPAPRRVPGGHPSLN